MLNQHSLPFDQPEPDQYRLPDMGEVDLSYLGRLADASSTVSAISEAEIDDPVTLSQRAGIWMILNPKGRVLGRMIGILSPPADTFLVSGKVGAIVRWRKVDNEEPFQAYIKRDGWETVIPEFVFRRNGGPRNS